MTGTELELFSCSPLALSLFHVYPFFLQNICIRQPCVSQVCHPRENLQYSGNTTSFGTELLGMSQMRVTMEQCVCQLFHVSDFCDPMEPVMQPTRLLSGVLQARILGAWAAMLFQVLLPTQGSSLFSCIARQIFAEYFELFGKPIMSTVSLNPEYNFHYYKKGKFVHRYCHKMPCEDGKVKIQVMLL